MNNPFAWMSSEVAMVPPLWDILFAVLLVEVIFIFCVYNNKDEVKRKRGEWIAMKFMSILVGALLWTMLNFMGAFMFLFLTWTMIYTMSLIAIVIIGYFGLNYLVVRIIIGKKSKRRKHL